jgi:hypothetical protein
MLLEAVEIIGKTVKVILESCHIRTLSPPR